MIFCGIPVITGIRRDPRRINIVGSKIVPVSDVDKKCEIIFIVKNSSRVCVCLADLSFESLCDQ